jgi:hypothetical protein
MATRLTHDFVFDLAGAMELPEPIVDFGSLQTDPPEGDLRRLFHGRSFTGTDVRDGPGVDRIEDLRALSYRDGGVGTAICLDTLEHCADPVRACRELRRVTATGGVCIVSSVMLFGIHAHPRDYFRFTPDGLRLLLEGFDEVQVASIGDPRHPFHVLAVATKGRALGLDIDELPSVAGAQRDWVLARGQIRVDPLRFRPRQLAALLARETARNVWARLSRTDGSGAARRPQPPQPSHEDGGKQVA